MKHSHLTRYSSDEIAEIADNLLRVYPKDTLEGHLNTFKWQDKPKPEAWRVRLQLERTAQAVSSEQSAVDAAQKIHRWGFGGQTFPNLNKHQDSLLDLFKKFSSSNQERGTLEAILANMLSLPGIGIATASKWTCFSNQTRYPIFDSRVSIALIPVKVDDNHRAFPIVARESGKRKSYRADNVTNNPSRMSRAYLDYVDVLSLVSHKTGFISAEIEMALFMAGDRWPCSGETIPKLRHGMWSEVKPPELESMIADLEKEVAFALFPCTRTMYEEEVRAEQVTRPHAFGGRTPSEAWLSHLQWAKCEKDSDSTTWRKMKRWD